MTVKIGRRQIELLSEEERKEVIDEVAAKAWELLPLINSGKYWLVQLSKWTMGDEEVYIASMAKAEQTARLADAQERTADAQERVAKAMEQLADQIGSEYISVLVTQA